LKSAPAATSDTLEESLNYTKTKHAPQLLLVLLPVLLLARRRLRQLLPCCHLQECTTLLAMHAPLVPSTEVMLRKALPLLPLHILPWQMRRSMLQIRL